MARQENISSLINAVIVTYNSEAVIGACLDSLSAANISAVVVDNASTDDSVKIVSERGVPYVGFKENLGFGRGMNMGVGLSSAPYCLLINPDATVDSRILLELEDAVKQYPKAVILAPEITEPDGRIFTQAGSLLETKEAPLIVSGACMLVNRKWFTEQKGFDQNIFLFYEDDDLCRRAWDSGHQVVYIPSAKVRHLRGKSTAPSYNHTYIIRYHQAWSRRYICKKYGLESDHLKRAAISFFKLLFAALTFKKQRMARYLGSLRGSLTPVTKA